MENLNNQEIKRFTEEDEKNFIVEKFLFLSREQEQTEKEMIELCCKIVSEHGTSMEDAIDQRRAFDMSE